MSKAAKVALVEFPRTSFGQKYSFLTHIEDLKENDLLLVQTRTGYTVVVFRGYTTQSSYVNVATKWVIENIQPKVDDFEEKLLLGELE